MDTDWEDYLHWSFSSAHVLFSVVQLDSWGGFLLGCLLAVAVTFSERFLTFVSEKRWRPLVASRSHFRYAFWRAVLYWMLTLLRLGYMLIAMSFHAGLVLVTITSLAFAQFFVELAMHHEESSRYERRHSISDEQPLLQQPLQFMRPRSKSRPDDIFIHPNLSNIARADAAALELGLTGSTDRVHSSYQFPLDKDAPWQAGEGRNAARALLGEESRFKIAETADILTPDST